MKCLKNQPGFTLLIAVLVSSIMLSIGYSLVNLSVKQILLSAAGRESQFAFYAADAGIECALFYENGAHTIDGLSIFDYQSTTNSVTCGVGGAIPLVRPAYIDSSPGNPTVGTITSSLSLQSPIVTRTTTPTPCVEIFGTRVYDKANQTSNTTIESAGYNTCDVNSPTRLQRSIRVNY